VIGVQWIPGRSQVGIQILFSLHPTTGADTRYKTEVREVQPIPPTVHRAPLQVAEDTFIIQSTVGEGIATMSVSVNSLVIRGAEPIVIDTGGRNNRANWLTDVFSHQAGDAAVFMATPMTGPQDEATRSLVKDLRRDVIGPVMNDTGARAYVAGNTTAFIDLSDKVMGRLAIFMSAVVGLSFVLLMVVFRSVLVPLKAAIMNLLAIGAAYGVVVAVFQWGWASSLFGVHHHVPINPFVPMIMFAILFGLSMDYEVFLLSRVREEFMRTGDSHTSVVDGLSNTARVITSAALIMISVFLAFVGATDITVKMFGVGLASAVFVDATLVRMVLVPSTMALLGKANWWLPAWLDRILPHLDLEADLEAEPEIDESLGELDNIADRPMPVAA
jgi:uncharacterized membrane protein YdfJ with MMPL/SSD domain